MLFGSKGFEIKERVKIKTTRRSGLLIVKLVVRTRNDWLLLVSMLESKYSRKAKE